MALIRCQEAGFEFFEAMISIVRGIWKFFSYLCWPQIHYKAMENDE